MVFKIIGNPVDAKVTGSTKVNFTLEEGSLMEYINSSNATVDIESVTANLAYDILIHTLLI